MNNRRGQTILEYTLIVIIMLGVVIAMKDFVKRGFQGRWKSTSDDFGEQYDPRAVNSLVNYAVQTNSESIVRVYGGDLGVTPGQWTARSDLSSTLETKTGQSQVGN